MTKCSSAQKGTVHFIVVLVVLVIVGGIVWFLAPKKDSKISPQDFAASFQAKPFQDVSPDDKNYAAIKYLSREGILDGNKDGKFNPQDTMSRAGWMQVLVKLTGITPDENVYKNCFPDFFVCFLKSGVSCC